MGKLSGRTALIIGASRGLGRAIAVGYAREGANLIALARDLTALERLADELAPLGTAVVVRSFDVLESGAYPRLVGWLGAAGLDFDIVVHTPGGGPYALAVGDPRVRAQIARGNGHIPFWEIEDEDLERVLQLGVKSVINCSKYLAPALMRQRRGSIIVLGSGAGLPGYTGHGHMSAYCAEKGAVIAYVLAVARELKPYRVAANVLLPGGIMRTTLIEAYPRALSNPTLLPPEAIVPAAVFLAEQTADGVTGQIFDAREHAEEKLV
jgi:NAD(P)-dependent dehydrogenase (short-subunit alcohol dehydrogenase family)